MSQCSSGMDIQLAALRYLRSPEAAFGELGALQNAGSKQSGPILCIHEQRADANRDGSVRMLEKTVELLGGLCLSALTLLIGFCIVVSIVEALRSVSGEALL